MISGREKRIAGNILREVRKPKVLSDNVMDYILEQKNYNPDSFYHWIQKEGFESEEVEFILYGFALKYAQFVKAGKSYHKHLTEHDVDETQLRMGINVEMEHTDDPEVSKKIALDHLAEYDNYYDGLKKMEEELAKQEKE